ncbi:alpha/beta hydrolase [Micromonospora sp. WMMA1363]|uniref:alpha/beta hydrolase n=1 Tax=Micromonospora sp. WMMA1363 TaxID=3053985 RepID=UPI00259C98DC|nr:alpha/beta hydrolase [Micromonospora sp. WMMA1363]MDM4720427.1 alpha/beta hydrolase [Micromonospora sp. WMMA1363]
MEPDVLGPPYERQTIDLGTDDEGPVVATLVRRRADRPTGRAVLYVHGYVDYFFQTHLADFFANRGWDFYALDLRKYGRSLLPHQTPNFCLDLAEYFPELDAAAKIIRADDGHDIVLGMGHSTGGLIISLWAHARRNAGLVDGLFLNSPFFDLNLPWVLRRPGAAAIARLAHSAPKRVVRPGLGTVYGESIHADHRGEWSYDLAWKPLAGFPVRAGWLAAIRRGQQQLRGGLDIPVPVLVAASTRSFRGLRWRDAASLADAVLDVEHIVRWAPRLGRHVTLARFDNGLHDLTLSGLTVRDQVFAEVGRWTDAFLGAGPTIVDDAPTAPEARVPALRPPTEAETAAQG